MMTLTPRHKSIAMKLCFGYSPKEVADEFGISIQTIKRWLLEPIFVTEVQEYQNRVIDKVAQTQKEEAQRHLDDALPTAATLIKSTIGDKGVDMKHRLACAFDVLNRRGVTTPKTNLHVVGDIGAMIEAAYRKNHPDEDAQEADFEETSTDTPKAEKVALPISASAGE
jgi:hypothetical protein